MPNYTAPLRDMHFVMHEVFNAASVFKTLPKHQDVDQDTINQILDEAAKFAKDVVQPLNRIGDEQGCTRHPDGSVTTPAGFKQAYEQYVAAGWPSLACSTEQGGQGLPILLNTVLYEMLNSANQAWTMYPGLSHGAYECLQAHGTPEQKNLYLKKLVSGEWLGTCLLYTSPSPRDS